MRSPWAHCDLLMRRSGRGAVTTLDGGTLWSFSLNRTASWMARPPGDYQSWTLRGHALRGRSTIPPSALALISTGAPSSGPLPRLCCRDSCSGRRTNRLSLLEGAPLGLKHVRAAARTRTAVGPLSPLVVAAEFVASMSRLKQSERRPAGAIIVGRCGCGPPQRRTRYLGIRVLRPDDLPRVFAASAATGSLVWPGRSTPPGTSSTTCTPIRSCRLRPPRPRAVPSAISRLQPGTWWAHHPCGVIVRAKRICCPTDRPSLRAGVVGHAPAPGMVT